VRSSYSGTRFAPAYLGVQAIAVAGWWAALAFIAPWRAPFIPAGAAWPDLLAFALPDAAVIAASALACALLASARPWGLALAWLAAGTMVYSAGFCIAWSVLRGGAWLSVALMVPAAGCSVLAAIDASQGSLPLFRVARAATAGRNAAKTLGQILLFWSVFLGVVPALVVLLERRLGLPEFRAVGLALAGLVLFLAASALGLAAAWGIVLRGLGTPLPMDATRRLVTTGVYACLRNPMVVAGLAQGLGVGLWLGSPLVIVYVVAGGLVWQLLVRPAEERDMRHRFGPAYDDYCRHVRCWVPRLR